MPVRWGTTLPSLLAWAPVLAAIATATAVFLQLRSRQEARRRRVALRLELVEQRVGLALVLENRMPGEVEVTGWGVAGTRSAPPAFRRRWRDRLIAFVDEAPPRDASVVRRGPVKVAELVTTTLPVAPRAHVVDVVEPSRGLVGWIVVRGQGTVYSNTLSSGDRRRPALRRAVVAGAVLAAAVAATMVLVATRDRAAGAVRLAGFAPDREAAVCDHRCPTLRGAVFNVLSYQGQWDDERSFLEAFAGVPYDPGDGEDVVLFVNGDEFVTVRALVHNAGDGDAHGTRLRWVAQPVPGEYRWRISADLSADDSRPRVVRDTVDVAGERPLSLTYAKGSARLLTPSAPARPLDDEGLFDEGIPLSGEAGSVVWVEARFDVSETLQASKALPRPTLVRGDQVFWGPDRPLYACRTTRSCGGSRFVSLNSYENSPPFGFEPTFLSARLDGASAGPQQSHIAVRPGDVLTVRFIFNNAAWLPPADPAQYTRNLRALLVLPAFPRRTLWLRGLIGADNARPRVVYSTLQLTANEPVVVVPVPGSAYLNNNLFRGAGANRISDALFARTLPQPAVRADDPDDATMVRHGPLLGYARHDGRIAGSFAESGFVYARVRVVAGGPIG